MRYGRVDEAFVVVDGYVLRVTCGPASALNGHNEVFVAWCARQVGGSADTRIIGYWLLCRDKPPSMSLSDFH